MRSLSLIVLLGLPMGLSGALVNFFAGGSNDAVVFETAMETELVGGTMFAGTFDTEPGSDITLADVLSDFAVFDSLDDPSNAAGYFSGDFDAPVDGTLFAGAKIYLVVVDTLTIASATEFAVFSSTDLSWTFPAADPPLALPANITLVGMVDQYYAGSEDTIDNPGGSSRTFDSIQLESTTSSGVEPSQTTFVVDAGFPGVQFDFPTAQAGSVTFTLEKSDTLQPGSWETVSSTPTIESDDGTTQVIQILDTVPLASQTENYYRVVYSTP